MKRRRLPEIVVRDGRPTAVILDIEEYETLLARLEDLEDLKALRRMRREPAKLKPLEEFVREYSPGV